MTKAGFLPREDMTRLIGMLRKRGCEVIGPKIANGAIIYAPIESASELPGGIRDKQAPGSYKLQTHPDGRFFAWANGPQALKPLVFRPRDRLWTSWYPSNGGVHFGAAIDPPRPTAVIGVRACDLAALALQDQHFLKEPYADEVYRARRASLFLVAVHCTHPADTCFCASTGDGPEAVSGFDLALYEIESGFIVVPGSQDGNEVLGALALDEPSAPAWAEAHDGVTAAAAVQKRRLPSRELRDTLLDHLEDPEWASVASRCLSCGNCTSVCPSCFCYAETDEPASDGLVSEHFRHWDSCFTAGHSRLHGIVVRAETRERYRQWLVHKLATWHDQYGRAGCVGCGRCITWCPVGIDMTAVVDALGSNEENAS